MLKVTFMSSVENQKGVNILKRFCWDPEQRYCCTKVYGDSDLLVLNGTLLNSVNALLALSRQCTSTR